MPHRLTRRAVLAGVQRAFGAGLFVSMGGQALAAPTGAVAATTEIAPGVHVHVGAHEVFSARNAGDISNCGFIIADHGVAVIDTGGSQRTGAALLAAIRAITDKPITAVINTHMHPDHVLGNIAFEPEGARIIAHHKMGRGLAQRAERYLAAARDLMGEAAFAGTEVVLPDQAIASDTTIDIGGRRLRLSPLPTAHTDNDLVITDETTGTVFLGDLVFAGHVPTIDGSIQGWQAALLGLASQPAPRVVPGHGPAMMVWPDAASAVARYLSLITAEVRAQIKAGGTIDEAMTTAARGEAGAWLLFEEFHARNVAAAFAELEWE
ncbi:MAG: quinoprotein relay system zinc metallohydrolase 2 [Hyphomicrobiaceae bacterium]|nr:quinoprotein relay system zinc metallohydrolase 2 [Hyphomicrobiaceae bacterium]